MTTARGKFRRIPGWMLQGIPLLAAAAVAMLAATLLFGSVSIGLFLGAIFTVLVALPVYVVASLGSSWAGDRLLGPPGIPLAALIVVSLGFVAIALSAPWDALGFLFMGLLMWAFAGTLLLVKLGLVAVREGVPSLKDRWRRWLCPFALGVLGFALAVSGISFTVRFELSRPALDGAAAQARAGSLSPGNPVQLGLFSGEVSTCDRGGACFYVGTGLSAAYYFVQLPEGTQPAGDEGSTWSRLGGGWWLNAVVLTSR